MTQNSYTKLPSSNLPLYYDYDNVNTTLLDPPKSYYRDNKCIYMVGPTHLYIHKYIIYCKFINLIQDYGFEKNRTQR
jgi:hypothetical protein